MEAIPDYEVRKHRTLSDILEDAKAASPIKVKRQPVKPLHPEQMYIKKHLMKMKSKQPLTNRKEIYKKILERWENLPPRKRVKYHLQYIKDWEDFVKANEEFLQNNPAKNKIRHEGKPPALPFAFQCFYNAKISKYKQKHPNGCR
ncbi:uncharacterized protein LOC112564878 isoform X4 [Pomacea canaliculata]|uniref:uncharacterized protein LOC112564878 isoform X4 n=1 Tax=Pomacea canaliculata TaxID=400727 RepID=UPI000D735042|nr:uncharacterized protein LOC112564878 isoform X4 [Pomacea canaliculata]